MFHMGSGQKMEWNYRRYWLSVTDVYEHGAGRHRIYGGAFGNATFTRLWTVGNGFGGFITTGNQVIKIILEL